MTEERILNEKTRVSVSIASWWHVVVIVGAIIWWGASIKVSIDEASLKAEKATATAFALDLRLRDIETDIKLFHQKYDDDMNRYIRDYNDPNRKRP